MLRVQDHPEKHMVKVNRKISNFIYASNSRIKHHRNVLIAKMTWISGIVGQLVNMETQLTLEWQMPKCCVLHYFHDTMLHNWNTHGRIIIYTTYSCAIF